MIERIVDMPPGTIGFRASGAVGADDYRDVLEPALRQAAEAGEIRMLYLVDDDLDMTAGGVAQDARIGLELGIGRHTAWKRSAVVTDVEWVRHALRLFAWAVPGDFKSFGRSELEDAKRWLSASE